MNGISLATYVGILAIVAPYQGPVLVVVVDAGERCSKLQCPNRNVLFTHIPRSAGAKNSSALLWDQKKQIV